MSPLARLMVLIIASAATSAAAQGVSLRALQLQRIAQWGVVGVCRLQEAPAVVQTADGRWMMSVRVIFRVVVANVTTDYTGTMLGTADALEGLSLIPDGFHGQTLCSIDAGAIRAAEFRMERGADAPRRCDPGIQPPLDALDILRENLGADGAICVFGLAVSAIFFMPIVACLYMQRRHAPANRDPLAKQG